MMYKLLVTSWQLFCTQSYKLNCIHLIKSCSFRVLEKLGTCQYLIRALYIIYKAQIDVAAQYLSHYHGFWFVFIRVYRILKEKSISFYTYFHIFNNGTLNSNLTAWLNSFCRDSLQSILKAWLIVKQPDINSSPIKNKNYK